MSIVSSEPEPMDTSEAMDYTIAVGELADLFAAPMDTSEAMDFTDAMGDWADMFAARSIKDDFFESFFANASIDEKGRVVRRSPRLGGATGSFFMPSGDGRTLRRSARTRQ
jgi:hypothetical protein